MDSDAVGDDGGMRAWQPSAENADRDIVLPRGDNMKRTNVSPIMPVQQACMVHGDLMARITPSLLSLNSSHSR